MSKSFRVLYFAALGEALNCREEQVQAVGVKTAGDLRAWLAERGPSWAPLQEGLIRMAVNQIIATPQQPVKDGDEVAFFPPVTGG